MIGIVSAMNVEMFGLQNSMQNKISNVVSGINFISGNLWGVPCVAAISGCGKINAAVCTQTMILNYKPTRIINIGVAGSLSDDLKVLDVAISKDVVQYDVDTTALGDPKGFISGLDVVKIPASQVLVNSVAHSLETLGNYNFKIGTIASGDKFISDVNEGLNIKRNFSAIATEMEGAAIGQVCYMNKMPFIVIRVISDVIKNPNVDMYNKFLLSAKDKIYDLLATVLPSLNY